MQGMQGRACRCGSGRAACGALTALQSSPSCERPWPLRLRWSAFPKKTVSPLGLPSSCRDQSIISAASLCKYAFISRLVVPSCSS